MKKRNPFKNPQKGDRFYRAHTNHEIVVNRVDETGVNYHLTATQYLQKTKAEFAKDLVKFGFIPEDA